MPHNTLRIQGGVVTNETPVLNQAGIASSNRIRFKYDPQGLSLVEKLGGWARFLATQLTGAIVRALWGWQDTNGNQWLAYAEDSATATSLWAVQCTVNGTTGLTSATGTPKNITPNTFSSQGNCQFETAAGSNQVSYHDFNAPTISPNPLITTVYISPPVSVGGIVLSGNYATLPNELVGTGIILATDVLGNPLPASYTTINAFDTIGGVVFTPGSPATLTITLSASSYIFPVGENVNVIVADNTITGSYIVLSSSAGSFTVATNLSSYTFSTTGTATNFGVVPIYTTSPSSSVVTVTFPDHGQVVGGQWLVINPTTVGGINLYGYYNIITVPNSYTFTIQATSVSIASTNFQYQGAIPVTGGSSTGSTETLLYATNVFNNTFQHAIPAIGSPIYIDEVVPTVPSVWNGTFNVTTGGSGTITVHNTGALGSWSSGGSFSLIGGMVSYVYNIVQELPPANSTAFGATFWTLDSWGNDLIATPGHEVAVNYPSHPLLYQPIYYWDATQGAQASAISTGPLISSGAFVAMPERQIIAWGSSFDGVLDPLLIRWCDINNFNTWVAQTTNQAGSFRLPSGSAIMGGRQVNQQGLIWTDIELWSMQYINQPLVYSFNKIGVGCGLIGRYAQGVLGGITYWMGKTQFFMLSGDGVVSIPCPIWDVVFQDLDLVNVAKITCAPNSMFQEIAWYFPVKGGNGENSQYVKLNVQGLVSGQGPIWDYGTLDRSAWIDVSILQQPIGYSTINQYIYQHEISPDADGAAMGESFTTGWFSITEGDVMPFVDQVWPDARWGYFGQTQNANITVTIGGQDYPGQSAQTVGPYTVSQSTTWISPRMRHRLLNFTVSGTGTGTWWRLGGFRYRWQPDGKF